MIKAEDARLLGDMKAMRSAYAQLYTLNAELIGEYNKVCLCARGAGLAFGDTFRESLHI